MPLDRRSFLRRLAQAGVAAPSLAGLARWSWASPSEALAARQQAAGYGPLSPSRDCPELEIPAGFRCQRVSVALAPSPARSSLVVPNAFDGMETFALPNGNLRLIRNHEMVDSAARGSPIGSPFYDGKSSGGTTSLEVRISGSGEGLRVELVDEFVSLAGTLNNCAGGPTPWGSWLSGEENCNGTSDGYDQPHGYVFEVPASATGPVTPVPLKAMGRFVHEAVAIDPDTGIVYETEDAYYVPTNPRQPGAGFFRFIPQRRDVLAEGGRLQVMTVPGQRNFLTARRMQPGTTVPAAWIDIEDPDPAAAETEPLTVFREGMAKGAAIFARLEGAFWGDGGVYFVSTSGGDARAGQVFHYKPTSANEGELTLIFASPSRDVLDAPDNVCIAPGGAGVILCEDGSREQFIRRLDRQGNVANLVRSPVVEGRPGPGEFAGACFSPGGRVMFFNVQGGRSIGNTYASATYAFWRTGGSGW